MIRITLPMPPSVNALYAGMRRRYKSKRYQAWIAEAREALRYQKWTPIADKVPLQITYTFGRPDKRIRDLANYLKAPDDLIVEEGIIADDSWIHRGIFEWGNSAGVTLDIAPL